MLVENYRFVQLATLLVVLPAVGMQQEDSYMPGRVVVQFKEGVVPVTGHAKTGLSSFDAVASPFGIYRVQQAFPMIEAAAAKRVLLPAARKLRRMYYVEYSGPFDPWEVVSGLLRSKEVERAEPHFTYEFAGDVSKAAIRDHYPAGRVVPDDELYDNQTHLNRMEMEAAWDVAKGEDGDIVIAIVDGGTDWRHPDLVDNVWVNADEIPGNGIDDDDNGYIDDVHGWNFSDGSADPTGRPGSTVGRHGTIVAGIAAAVTNNGIGIAGTGWNAKFMPINASCLRFSLYCWPTEATVYAVENGADVIVQSYVSLDSSFAEKTAMEFAVERGSVAVAAVGNFNVNLDETPYYPASYPTTLSVGGTEKSSDRKAHFSSYGRSVDVFAPAEEINSVIPDGGYGTAEGTSFAAPLVAGVAALVRIQWPDYGVYEVMEQIRQTVDDIDDAQPISLKGLMGRGRVNARRAVTEEEILGIRMVEFDWTDADGDGDLVPGESFTVEASFANYGSDTDALNIGIAVANRPPYVTVTSPAAAVGSVPRRGTFSASFDLEVDDSAPLDHTAILSVIVEDGEISSVAGHIQILVNIRDLPILSTSRLIASVTDEGNIGFPVSEGQSDVGEGFQFLSKDGRFRSILYEGGLLIGTGPTSLVDCVRSDQSEVLDIQNEHFQLVPGTGWDIEDDGLTTRKVSVEIQDSGAPNPLGVHVLQESYVDDTRKNDDFLVLQYTVTNTNEDRTLNGMWVGLFLDWDIGALASDTGVFDERRLVGMVFDSRDDHGGVGVKVLTSPAEVSYELVDNAITWPDAGGYTSAEKWEALSGGIGVTELEGMDLAQMIGAGPFDIAPQESVVAAFALIVGHKENKILAGAANAQSLWDKHLSVSRVANEAGSVRSHFDFAPVYPNPGNGRYSLSFTLPDAADVELVIYNALSQEVRALLREPRSAGVHTVEWNGINDTGVSVASGVYFARLIARGGNGRMLRSQPIVVVR